MPKMVGPLLAIVVLAVLLAITRATTIKAANAEVDRGNALDNGGHFAEAIVAYNHGIKLGAVQYGKRERGIAYLIAGKLDLAHRDLDEAILRDSSDGSAYDGRSWLKFDQGLYEAAASDAAQAAMRRPGDIHPLLQQYLSLRMAGKDALGPLRIAKLKYGEIAWPGPVVAMYLSEKSPETVEADAKADGGWFALCEWPYYVGEYYKLGRDESTARKFFPLAMTKACRPNIEFHEAEMAMKS